MSNNAYILLVEGQDDRHVVFHLCDSHKAMPKFCIRDKEGIEELLEDIGSEILAPGRKAVGILVDTDEDLNARWDAVKNRLREEGIIVPARPNPTGTIIENEPRIGIWLMPNNASSGELEDFVAKMIPDGDPVWPRSKSYIQSIPEKERKFAEKKILRAKVHAWLATRESPRQMGVAIRAKDLDTSGPLSTAFADWLRELFEPSP